MNIKNLKNIFMGAVLGVGLTSSPTFVNETPSVEPYPKSDIQIIHDICTSEKPRLIVDFFSVKKPDYGAQTFYHVVDVNGDYVADMSHGDFVAKVAEFSGQKILRFGLKTDQRKIKNAAISEDFKMIVSMLRAGKIPPVSAISFSIGVQEPIEKINAFFQSGTNADVQEPVITPDNIARNKERVIAKFEEKAREGNEYAKAVLAIVSFHKDLKEMGIPLVTVAGNQYSPNYINLHTIFGGISVGALTYDGKKIAAYSNNNSLTKIYRVGDFIGRKVQGGIDINGDHIPEFSDKILSSEQVSHKDIKGGRSYGQKEGISAEKTRFFARNYSNHIGSNNGKGFRKKPDGSIVFDPADNGDPAQVSLNTGTSFAVPNICGK